MIVCPVCATPNHHLNTVCTSCGGFVQGRVENLDLFSLIWRLIERPRQAFHQIAIARYKNYATIVPAISGAGFVFAFFWYIHAGDATRSAFSLLAGGLAAGPVVGVALTLVMSLLLFGALRVAGAAVRFRNLYAVLAYSTVPVLLGVIFVLPLEIFTFGRYFFSLNPPPWLIKPAAYYQVLGLGIAVACWTFVLGATGVRALLDCGRMAAAGVAAAMAALLAGAAWLAGWMVSWPG